ncbi:UNVERIFIED_CONTAM: putative indole-3-pyruvate monooxygenase YUCCA1 [Sesamum calycinum]|uniref:indole-3-pyruvate monooxygenase n=1 Tax=Sesamum calycinum TaxID=2727403 RepID=A0AAW2QWF7_9LAMI
MESYAKHFSIGPRFRQSVSRAEYDYGTGLWRVQTQDSLYYSRWLIVATGENASPLYQRFQGLRGFQGPSFTPAFTSRALSFETKGSGRGVWELRHGSQLRPVQTQCQPSHGGQKLGSCSTKRSVRIVDICNSNGTSKMAAYKASGQAPPPGGKLHLRQHRESLGSGGLKPALSSSRTPPERPRCSTLEHSHTSDQAELRFEEIQNRISQFMDGQEKEFDAIILATGYKSNVPTWLKGTDFFTEIGMPKAPFPNGWKGEMGLYAVGFTRKGILGTSSDAVNIARDIADQWRTTTNGWKSS